LESNLVSCRVGFQDFSFVENEEEGGWMTDKVRVSREFQR